MIATPAIPERPLLTFSFCTFLTAYPASGPSATALVLRLAVEALVDGDLVEPVGRGARERARERGEQERDDDRADGEERHSGTPRCHVIVPAVPSVVTSPARSLQLRLEIGRAVHDVGPDREHHGDRWPR